MDKRRMGAFAEIEYGRKKGEAQGKKIGMEKGLAMGIEQGIAMGIQQGIEKVKIEVAQNMLAQSIGLKVIAEVTGLSCERLRALQSQN